jgi:hypothetical protein
MQASALSEEASAQLEAARAQREAEYNEYLEAELQTVMWKMRSGGMRDRGGMIWV